MLPIPSPNWCSRLRQLPAERWATFWFLRKVDSNKTANTRIKATSCVLKTIQCAQVSKYVGVHSWQVLLLRVTTHRIWLLKITRCYYVKKEMRESCDYVVLCGGEVIGTERYNQLLTLTSEEYRAAALWLQTNGQLLTLTRWGCLKISFEQGWRAFNG